SAFARSFGAISWFGPSPTQDCATWPCPLSCNSFMMFASPPLSTPPAAAPPSRPPSPPGTRSLSLPPGVAPGPSWHAAWFAAEQPAEDVAEPAARRAGSEGATWRDRSANSAGRWSLTASALERLVGEEREQRHHHRRHPAPASAARLALAAR